MWHRQSPPWRYTQRILCAGHWVGLRQAAGAGRKIYNRLRLTDYENSVRRKCGQQPQVRATGSIEARPTCRAEPQAFLLASVRPRQPPSEEEAARKRSNSLRSFKAGEALKTPNKSRTFGLKDAKLIVPGRPESSVLLHRMGCRGPGQMPPLATAWVDEAALQMLREWVKEMRTK
jgi:hypothetical protein